VTVAAVILSASTAGALAPTDGVPRVRRLADVAWAGGAFPVVVVVPDPDGTVAAALAGTEATWAAPARPEAGPVGHIAEGIRVAAEAIAETEAVLVWPARHCWVDAETVTSLIEAHGLDRSSILRAAYRGEAGWPALLPLRHLDALTSLGPARMPGDLLDDLAAVGIASRSLELGDPGAVMDADTPREEQPPFEGPRGTG
jgi:CTP:molybdopterin cytidylyltransferase MocA